MGHREYATSFRKDARGSPMVYLYSLLGKYQVALPIQVWPLASCFGLQALYR